jgi:hypothetical protein
VIEVIDIELVVFVRGDELVEFIVTWFLGVAA